MLQSPSVSTLPSSSSSGLLSTLYRAGMGCICSRETLVLEGTKYQVLDRLAEGGFSTIDLVERCGSHGKDHFALKRITCHSHEDQLAALAEAEFHRRLDHPNVIRLVSSGCVGQADIVHNKTSEVLLLLPYYPRGTLHDELVKRSFANHHFTEDFVIKLFLQISAGVLHMHAQEPDPLAHRDLKPHNVLLTKDMTPVIMDLGSVAIARVRISSHSEAQHLQDTAGERCSMPYRSPELFQVNSKCEIDERTDVWSLGCLLYALCFFKSPYDSVFERGDSVALAVQSNNLAFPADSPFSTDMHNAITWMLTPEIAVRPHLQQIVDKLRDMEPKATAVVVVANGGSAVA